MAFAQQQMPPIPVDPNVRIGKLDNGLTYYIRHFYSVTCDSGLTCS